MLPLSTLWQKQGPTETQYLKNTCLAGLQHGKNHRCLQVGRDGKPNQKLGRPVMWNGKSSSVWQIRCCLEIKKPKEIVSSRDFAVGLVHYHHFKQTQNWTACWMDRYYDLCGSSKEDHFQPFLAPQKVKAFFSGFQITVSLGKWVSAKETYTTVDGSEIRLTAWYYHKTL